MAVTLETNYWELVPVLVDAKPRWLLRKHHSDGVKNFRDHHGHFETVADAEAAIIHLESAPVRIAAKAAE